MKRFVFLSIETVRVCAGVCFPKVFLDVYVWFCFLGVFFFIFGHTKTPFGDYLCFIQASFC